MYVPTGAGPLRNLDECLRAAHERLREVVDEEIARRREVGVPLDNDTDFADIAVRLKKAEAACEEHDGAALKKCLSEALGAVSGGLEPLSPYQPSEDLASLSVRLKGITEADRLAFDRRLSGCATPEDRHALKLSLVAECVDELVGLENDEGQVRIKADGDRLPADALRVIEVADLTEALYQAIKAFHQIPAAKKKRFGLPAPLASETSIALAALSVSESSADATVAPKAPTDSQSQTGAVLVGTGSTTQRSETGTASTEEPKGNLAPVV